MKRGRPPTRILFGQPSRDGRWLILRPDPGTANRTYNSRKFVCSCIGCGNESVIVGSSLRTGRKARCWVCEPPIGPRPREAGQGRAWTRPETGTRRTPEQQERAGRIAGMLRAGNTRREVAVLFGVTPERIRQIGRSEGVIGKGKVRKV